IPMPKCHGWHFEHNVTGCHIDASEELQDKVLVISSKFPKMGFCSRIKLKSSQNNNALSNYPNSALINIVAAIYSLEYLNQHKGQTGKPCHSS
ncbi:MAG: hypothetical protein N2489_10650, partial [Clostridia bacterium]|nr:hypothetical protein [Clostridia bacterium]